MQGRKKNETNGIRRIAVFARRSIVPDNPVGSVAHANVNAIWGKNLHGFNGFGCILRSVTNLETLPQQTFPVLQNPTLLHMCCGCLSIISVFQPTRLAHRQLNHIHHEQ